jgi:D-alanyl-D-alanine carboxypeptidase
MFERFVKEARRVAAQAREEARLAGATSLEAEHILLSLAGTPGTAQQVLAAAGLDHRAVQAALEAETRHSLEAVGVSLDAFDLPAPAPATGEPRWGASAKQVLESALSAARARGDGHISGGHILLSLLQSDTGTVPRALALAGVDRQALAASTHAALDEGRRRRPAA